MRNEQVKEIVKRAGELQTKMEVCKKMLEARMCELDAHTMLGDTKLVEHSRVACVSSFEALLDATIALKGYVRDAGS